jgi:G3E family GTPase
VRDDLVKALNKLHEQRESIDHIIIETTGATGQGLVLWGLVIGVWMCRRFELLSVPLKQGSQ